MGCFLEKTKKKQGKKLRLFSTEWYKAYPWLVLCSTSLKAFCYYCKYSSAKGYLQDKNADEAFVKTGFNNWKKAHERFKKHAKSSAHKESIMKVRQMKAPGIDALLDRQLKQDQLLHRRMLILQLSSMRFLLRQGLALRGHEPSEGSLMQLLTLRSEDTPALKDWIKDKKYLSSEIINELIAHMSRNVTLELLEDIRGAQIYSLIADEATDITNKEQLCISLRWVDKSFVIHEDALEIIELPKTDAETISKSIKDFLIRYQLPLAQCRGQAYDGAATMSGIVSGVATRLQQEEPTAIFVHCLAHSLNLCLQTMTKRIIPIKEALDLTKELGIFIDLSPKRSHLFEVLQKQLAPDSPSIKMLCPTRWTVRTKALEAIIKNYEVLTEAMSEIYESGRDEYAMKAVGFLQILDKFSTYFGLKLAYLIFSAAEQLSVTLQSKNTTIQEAVSSSKLAVSFLERQRSEEAFELFYQRVLEDSKNLTSEPVLPRYRRQPRRLDDGSEAHRFEDAKSLHKQQYFEAIETVKGEVTNRFQQTRGMPVAASLEKTLLDSFNGTCELPDEIKAYSKDLDLSKLKIQLQLLPDLLKTFNEENPAQKVTSVTSLRTLCDLMNSIESSKSLLSEVCQLLHIIFTIPVTSATAERTFSAMRRLKTFLRSSMTQLLFNNVLLLHVHKEKTGKRTILTFMS